jgi:hypothetical protein
VEVSVDGGLSWHPASGREAWTYTWTPSGNGLVTLISRAVDDSGNLETPGPGTRVTVGAPPPVQAPGGPILVIVNGSYSANPFGRYLTEMLRTEGLMLFREVQLGWLVRKADPLAFLRTFPLVLLAETRLLPAQQDLIRAYVAAGGNLVAMRPEPALADLFGLKHVGVRPETSEQFFAFDTTTGPGVGITAESLQYHGPADTYTTAGASVLASFWDDLTTPSAAPAVTRHSAGGGQAIAFAFDLAKSIVLMRQGNPDWVDSEGDAAQGPASGPGGVDPGNLNRPDEYRAMDMFARTDGRMWFAPERLSIPQADEQQRFLGHLVLDLLDQPVPRLWYLPGMHRRVIVNTGDTCYSSAADRAKLLGDVVTYGAHVTLYLWNQAGIDDTTEASWRTDGHEHRRARRRGTDRLLRLSAATGRIRGRGLALPVPLPP